MTTKYLYRPFECKSTGNGGRFTGYASVFGELDSYRDIVMPGAFKDSLARFTTLGRKVPMLWQHSSREPIGVYTEIREDDKGLYVEGECNLDVVKGQECHALMKQGALSGLSIGYETMREEIDTKSGVRRLLEVDLWEISPVTFPAGDSARVNSVKSIEGLATLAECEALLRDVAGFSHKASATFISRIKAIGTQSDSADEQVAQRVKSALAALRN